MAEMVGLMDTEIHLVWDQWWGKKELCAANYVARRSAKDLHYFWVVSPLKSPKIMGLKRIHTPKALKHQASLLFCPWCRKEGQNEGTMVNHLCTRHYCLGLICERCLSYFTTTSDTMQHHTQGSESMHFCKGKPDKEVEKSPWYPLDRATMLGTSCSPCWLHQHPHPAMKEMPQYLMKTENDKIGTKSKIKVD